MRTRRVPDGITLSELAAEPAAALLKALHCVIASANTGNLREIADRRARFHTSWNATRGAVLAAGVAPDGDPMAWMAIPNEPNEPPALLDAVERHALGPTVHWARESRAALRRGGGAVLDAPGSTVNAGELATIILRIESACARVRLALGAGSAPLIEPVAELCTLTDRAAEYRDRVQAGLGLPRPTPTAAATPRTPKTRRGLLRLAATTDIDTKIIGAVRDGMSYRRAAETLGVSKSTVARVAKAYGMTGHAMDAVPPGGTLAENLNIRERPRKRKKT